MIAAHLVLSGGGETTPAMVQAFFHEIGGAHHRIVVLAQTRESPSESGPGSVELLRSQGASDVHLVDATTFTVRSRKALAELIFSSRGVWIPGGDQGLFLDRLGADWFRQVMSHGFRRGMVAFGTSAGAMIWSDPCIVGSEDNGQPILAKGVGLIPFLVDSHFRERNRSARLAAARAKSGIAASVGLDAGEWIVVRSGQISLVYGRPEWTGISPR